MNKYDPEAKCVKCGSTSAAVRNISVVIHDYMKRVCCTCGHDWLELPLDASGDREEKS